jgi:N-methylhydantoinase B/oxoprolinase/acetone carboxylase alpha subunit
VPPWGLSDGGSRTRNVTIVCPADAPELTVFKDKEILLPMVDRATFLIASGGGYGGRRRCDPKQIENDVAQGFVSPNKRMPIVAGGLLRD